MRESGKTYLGPSSGSPDPDYAPLLDEIFKD
jgi:hypothetical protein